MNRRKRLAAAALGALLALLIGAGGARAQSACTPTQTVSAEPDENGVYTTMVTCADTSAAPGAADYERFYWNQANDPDSSPNNNNNNHVVLTVGSDLVISAEGHVDFRSLDISAIVYLVNGGAKTIVVEEGAVLYQRRTPEYWCQSADAYCSAEYQALRPAATPEFNPAWYRNHLDVMNNQVGIWIWSGTGDGVVRFHGELELDMEIRGTFANFPEQGDGWSNNGNAIQVIVGDADNTAGARAKFDAVVELGAAAVIRQKEGSAGGNGIYVENNTEDGDIRIDLAAGSMIDVSTVGGRGLNAWILPRSGWTQRPQSGDIFINAAGTIKASVGRKFTNNALYGVGISAFHNTFGRIRIVSSGIVETWQANAILLNAAGGAHRDDPATEEIEGHLIDVAGGKVHTRGGSAVFMQVRNAEAASTVRVAEGALVRAELDAGPDAVTQEQLGASGRRYLLLRNVYGWRRIDTDGDDVNDALEPIITAIAVGRLVTAAEGVTDRVIVNGRVEAVGGKKDVDPAIYIKNGGEAIVGASGRVSADSGVAILSGAAPPAELPEDYTPLASDLVARVAGSVTGDIRVLDAGALTADVSGTVEGDLETMGAGMLSATVSGEVTGDIRSAGGLRAMISGAVGGSIEGLGAGDHTVTVARGGVVTGTIHLAASVVTVHGTVGNVCFDKGGTLTVGPTGRILSREGVAVCNARGDLAVTIRAASGERLEQTAARVRGRIEGSSDGETTVRMLASDGSVIQLGEIGSKESVPSGPYDVGVSASADGGIVVSHAFAPRARVYEALPSVLLGMSALPTHGERMAASRSASGVWARVEGGGGDWKADESATDVEYDVKRYGARVGVDSGLGAGGLLGFSAHHKRGAADVKDGGEIEVSGNGLGVSASWTPGGGFYLDGQFEATWYEANLESDLRGKLASNLSGFGWAAGAEAGRRMKAGDVFLTPRARLVHASVSMDKFTDPVGSTVEIEDGKSLMGGLGFEVGAEAGAGRLFASLDFEHEFSAETIVKTSGTKLEASAESSRFRARVGGVHAPEGSNWSIRGAVDYVTSGDSREIGGGLSLRVRF